MSQITSLGSVPIPPGTYVETITGDTGGAVSGPNINLISNVAAENAGSTVSFVGNPGLNTITLDVTDTNLNTTIGRLAGNIAMTGSFNTALGVNALNSITTGTLNTAVGHNALAACTTTSGHTAVGQGALASIGSNGNNNTAVGFQCMASATGAFTFNSGLGTNALLNRTGGANNCAFGSSVLAAVGNGNNNTAMGDLSLSNLGGEASNNTVCGYASGTGYTVGNENNNCIFGITAGVAGESNVLRLGNDTSVSAPAATTTAYIQGVAGVSVANALPVVIDSTTGQLGTSGNVVGTWTVVTGASQTLVAGNGYIANNAGTINFSLPATAGIGDSFKITGINNATGWQVTQAAGQQIFIGTSNTTLGVGGSLTSSATRDSIEMICVVANTTFQVVSMMGNVTVV